MPAHSFCTVVFVGIVVFLVFFCFLSFLFFVFFFFLSQIGLLEAPLRMVLGILSYHLLERGSLLVT